MRGLARLVVVPLLGSAWPLRPAPWRRARVRHERRRAVVARLRVGGAARADGAAHRRRAFGHACRRDRAEWADALRDGRRRPSGGVPAVGRRRADADGNGDRRRVPGTPSWRRTAVASTSPTAATRRPSRNSTSAQTGRSRRSPPPGCRSPERDRATSLLARTGRASMWRTAAPLACRSSTLIARGNWPRRRLHRSRARTRPSDSRSPGRAQPLPAARGWARHSPVRHPARRHARAEDPAYGPANDDSLDRR